MLSTRLVFCPQRWGRFFRALLCISNSCTLWDLLLSIFEVSLRGWLNTYVFFSWFSSPCSRIFDDYHRSRCWNSRYKQFSCPTCDYFQVRGSISIFVRHLICLLTLFTSLNVNHGNSGIEVLSSNISATPADLLSPIVVKCLTNRHNSLTSHKSFVSNTYCVV